MPEGVVRVEIVRWEIVQRQIVRRQIMRDFSLRHAVRRKAVFRRRNLRRRRMRLSKRAKVSAAFCADKSGARIARLRFRPCRFVFRCFAFCEENGFRNIGSFAIRRSARLANFVCQPAAQNAAARSRRESSIDPESSARGIRAPRRWNRAPTA